MIMLNASDTSVILPGTDVRRGTEEETDHYENGVRISENYRVWPVSKWTQKIKKIGNLVGGTHKRKD
jgi:hypothetical protein